VVKKSVTQQVDHNIDTFLEYAQKKYGCFKYESYLYTYYKEEGYYYVTVSDNNVSTSAAIQLLKDIMEMHKLIGNNEEKLKEKIAEKINEYNTMPVDKIEQIKNQLIETKQVMIENLKQLEERGVKLEGIMDQVEGLEGTSFAFRGRARTLVDTMWWKNTRLRIMLAVLGVVFVTVVVLILCGGFSFSQCSASPPTPSGGSTTGTASGPSTGTSTGTSGTVSPTQTDTTTSTSEPTPSSTPEPTPSPTPETTPSPTPAPTPAPTPTPTPTE